MKCVKCWYINEREGLSGRDKEQMTIEINNQEHDTDCKLS